MHPAHRREPESRHRAFLLPDRALLCPFPQNPHPRSLSAAEPLSDPVEPALPERCMKHVTQSAHASLTQPVVLDAGRCWASQQLIPSYCWEGFVVWPDPA